MKRMILALAIIADGFSAAFSRPLIDSLWADSLQDENRATQLGAGHLINGVFALPAGFLAAELYTRGPGLPFVASAVVFGVAALVALRLPRTTKGSK